MASVLQKNSTIESKSNFRRFDVVTDYSDHYYFQNPRKGNNKEHFTNAGSDTHKNIMKEWKLLRKHLPESIFVRVYEKRIDLLRAVIIGVQGTPYHDGLFFFDIAFPSDYPNNPPLVCYHSHGLRLNPNLYSNGFVCLSLLNTWPGKGIEMWNPGASTIFQVLISLQGLVLNEKPYYNEPGIRPARTWKHYSQDVFTLSCKTMQYLLQKPPKNFESFVAAHFQERGYAILRACITYRNGCVGIGFFSEKELYSKDKIKVSSSFKKSMDKIYGDLFAAFTRNGASLENVLQDLFEEETPRIEEGTPRDDGNSEAHKKEVSIYHKVYWKIIKLFLCFKKDDD